MKKMRLAAWGVCLFLLLSLGTDVLATEESDSYLVTRYDSENGLPTGEANAVLSTREGYIWVGGYGGLLRYDGEDFTEYGEEEGMTSYAVRSLWESEEGTLWVGSNEQGAFYYTEEGFLQPEADSSGKYLSVRAFAEDSFGRVWLGTSDGLCAVSGDKVYPLDLTAFGIENTIVYTLTTDASGWIWGVDYAGALFAIDPVTTTLAAYYLPGELWEEGVYAYSALAASDGALYVGTNSNKILKITDFHGTPRVKIISSGELSAVNAITERASGEIWFCGENGLGKISDGKFFDESALAYASHLQNITEDYEHNLWVASRKYGLLYITPGEISTLAGAPELSDAETEVIYTYKDTHYVGSEKGLLVFDKDWKRVESPLEELLTGIHCHQICGIGDTLYCGTYYNGLYAIDLSTGEQEVLSVEGKRCRVLLEMKNGELAVGTDTGVSFVAGNEIQSYVPTGASVLTMLETEEGTLLCGTDGVGILQVTSSSVESYASGEQGLSGGVVLRMVEDEDAPGQYWVSCGYDVFYGNRDGFAKTPEITRGNGSVVDILAYNGQVWLLRVSGLLRYAREDLLPGGDETIPAYFGTESGLPGPVVANASNLLEKEKLYITTTNGVGILDIAATTREKIIPKILLTGVTLSDGTAVKATGSLTLKKDITKLSLNLSVPAFYDREGSVEYQLEGLDRKVQTRTIEDLGEIEYTNLKPGTYLFRYRAISSDGNTGDFSTLTIIKEPRFTETTLFYGLMLGLVVGCVSFFYWLRFRSLRKKEESSQELIDKTIDLLSHIIDVKDPYTNGHSKRVADFSVQLAKKLNDSSVNLRTLYRVAQLHDIGKIGVPEQVLNKNGKLSDEEFSEIKRHTDYGYKILKAYESFPEAMEGARYHHERYDGKGYGEGIAGENIPLMARIIAVADSYDAMNSDRVYRKALPKEVILSELEKGKNSQFDARVAEVAIQLIKEEMAKETNSQENDNPNPGEMQENTEK